MDKVSRVEENEQKRLFWKEHFKCWQESGLTRAEYCRKHDLKQHRLTYWKKRFSSQEAGISFVPLQLVDRGGSTSLSLTIDDHYKVEIRSGFDVNLLRQLIFALRGTA